MLYAITYMWTVKKIQKLVSIVKNEADSQI